MSVLASLSSRGKAILAGCALAFVVVAVLLVKMASAPSYTEVMAGLDPAQTGKITAALDAKGIAYELRSNGTALAVEKAQVGPARIALATQGLNASGNAQPGFELLDKQKLGASSFQQQIAYQRALEGSIANTIGQIDGVSGAKVSLTLPKDQLFADEQKPATAAVLLGGSASTVEPGAVRGIANLVASSVQGLKASAVTITDGSGQMLWPQGDGGDGSDAGASKPAAEARYDAQLAASLDAMLVNTLGPGKAHVVVHSDLNVDRTTQDKLQYAKKGVPLKATADTETLKGSGTSAKGGAAGTASNIPAYAATGGGAGGKSDYKHTTKSTDFGVDKTVSHTLVAPGTVNKLDVAVLVDNKAVPLKSPALASLTSAVSAAAGIQKGRDTLAVTPVAFASQPAAAAAAGPLPAGLMGYVKTALIALAALAFLFFVTRHLRKRESDAFAHEPSWLRQLELPAGGAGVLAAGGSAPTERLATYDSQAAARALFQHDPKAMALEELVKSEPEKVALQLRSWITEDGA